jgi:hypothetical protein
MSDRIFAFTVSLDYSFKDEDAAEIAKAIGMIKGVADVTPLVANPDLYYAKESARRELTNLLFQALSEK